MRPKLLIYCSIASAGDKLLWGEAEPSPSSHRFRLQEGSVVLCSPNVFVFQPTVGSRLYSPTNSSVSRTQTRVVPGPISSPDLMSFQTGHQQADRFFPRHSSGCLGAWYRSALSSSATLLFFFFFFMSSLLPFSLLIVPKLPNKLTG